MSTKRFDKAYSALQNAYFDGTLGKGDCSCCAVGNIVSAAQGGRVTINKEILDLAKDAPGFQIKNLIKRTAVCSSTGNSFWGKLFKTMSDSFGRKVSQKRDPLAQLIIGNDKLDQEAKMLLDLTGYSEEEMSKIEAAFEDNTKIDIMYYPDYTEQEILEDQYNGLAAVLDVMLELDNETATPTYKAELRKHPKLELA